jgi:hypothetical protein
VKYAIIHYQLAPLGLLIAEDGGWKPHLSFVLLLSPGREFDEGVWFWQPP